MAYPAYDQEDDGTDSDTSSDDGYEDVGGPNTANVSEQEAAETIYMAYRRAKRVWRRYTDKPVRKFRRHFKKFNNTKGRGRGFFWTQDDVYAYLKGKGKGHRSHSSGKGFGRKKNPKDRNGNILKCHGCGSEDHLVNSCPQKGKARQRRSFFEPLLLRPNLRTRTGPTVWKFID